MNQIKCLFAIISSIYQEKELSIFVCYQFFKQIRTKFGNKPVCTDGAYWYNNACKWLSLNQAYYLRNKSQEYHGKIYSANQR